MLKTRLIPVLLLQNGLLVRSERFAVSTSEPLDSLCNVFIDEGRIVLNTKFKCQEFVIRAAIRMIFKSVCHFNGAHGPPGCGGLHCSAEVKRRSIAGLCCRC